MPLSSFLLHFENQRFCYTLCTLFVFLGDSDLLTFDFSFIENLHLWHIISSFWKIGYPRRRLLGLTSLITSAHCCFFSFGGLYSAGLTLTCQPRRWTHVRTPIYFVLLLLLFEPFWYVWHVQKACMISFGSSRRLISSPSSSTVEIFWKPCAFFSN